MIFLNEFEEDDIDDGAQEMDDLVDDEGGKEKEEPSGKSKEEVEKEKKENLLKQLQSNLRKGSNKSPLQSLTYVYKDVLKKEGEIDKIYVDIGKYGGVGVVVRIRMPDSSFKYAVPYLNSRPSKDLLASVKKSSDVFLKMILRSEWDFEDESNWELSDGVKKF